MEELLTRIRDGLAAGQYPNERAVSTSIVIPILRALGWDDADPVTVRPEYANPRGRVDYALFTRPQSAAVFLEVKGVGKSSEADRQLFEYAFHEGAQIAILTDGQLWNVYLPAEQGSYDDRRVHQIDLLERAPADAALRFHRYLDRHRVASGHALEDARRDYRDRSSQRTAEATLPGTWSDLLSGPDPMLSALLADRVESACGVRPHPETVARFLARAGTVPQPTMPMPTRAKAATVPSMPTPVAITPAPAAPVPTAHHWHLNGQSGTGRNQLEAWVGFLSALFAAFPEKQDAMAAAVRTKSRNNIARQVSDVYPGRPEIAAKSHVGLPGGWFLGTNESAGTKLRIARKAAEAAGLAWGRNANLELAS